MMKRSAKCTLVFGPWLVVYAGLNQAGGVNSDSHARLCGVSQQNARTQFPFLLIVKRPAEMFKILQTLRI